MNNFEIKMDDIGNCEYPTGKERGMDSVLVMVIM